MTSPNPADPRATAIARARLNLGKLTGYPGTEPESVEEAIRLQDSIVELLDDEVIGWKIGCTSETARKALGADGPFFGPLLASRRYENGASVDTGAQALRIVESEVAVTVSRDFSPRDKEYSAGDVLEGIGTVHPSLEIIDRRLPGGLDQGLFWNIADGGVNDAVVLGHGMGQMKADDFARIEVSIAVNGVTRSTGAGSDALGGAHLALHWLVNEFRKRKRTLRAGETVTTGLTTGIFSVNPGDHVRAEFTPLGFLEATIK